MKASTSNKSTAEKLDQEVSEKENEFCYSAELIGICNKSYQFLGTLLTVIDDHMHMYHGRDGRLSGSSTWLKCHVVQWQASGP